MKNSLIEMRALFACGIIIIFFAFREANISYTITGDISGLKSDSAVLVISNFDSKSNITHYDTFFTTARNDKFIFKGMIAMPSQAFISLGGIKSHKGFPLFIENGNININGNIDSLADISVFGTISNDDLTASNLREDPIYKERRKLYVQSIDSSKSENERNAIINQIDQLNHQLDSGRIVLIQAHPNSFASTIFLSIILDNISIEKAQKLYNGLSENMRNSSFGKKINNRIEGRKLTLIGNAAPDFTMKDIKGKSISLSGFRGKYVLLDFWASWCGPCRAEYPYLKSAYQNFKDKGFEIIGISLDSDKRKWMEAVKHDELKWINLSDMTAFDNKVAKLYGVQPIPDNFLIDPKGKIIARKLYGEDLGKVLKEIFK